MSGENQSNQPVALVYAEPLLAPSMTFVRSQGEALRSFLPYYVSPSHISNGLPLPADRIVVIHPKHDAIGRIAAMPFKLLGYAPGFVRRLHQLNPVLLHAHFGPMGLRALPLARRLQIPLIVTFHGYDATVPDELAIHSRHYAVRSYIKRRRHLQEQGALFLAVSRFIREKLVQQGFPGQRTKIHYIGVDTHFFRPSPSVRRESLVLFTGRLEEVKGCDYLIRAMAQVQSQMPEVALVVIGDGTRRRELEHAARRTLQRVRFLGFQPPEIVKEWMNRASLFAAPSVRTADGAEEGCGLALLEAQAMGLPVMSFLSGGIPEVVLHGATGLLAAERDWQSLAENILMVLRDPILCERMGEAARERVRAQFDLEKQTQELEKLYRSLCCPVGPQVVTSRSQKLAQEYEYQLNITAHGE